MKIVELGSGENEVVVVCHTSDIVLNKLGSVSPRSVEILIPY